MVSLTDPQLKIIMTAANAVPIERRPVFLERVGAMPRHRRPFTDDDVQRLQKGHGVRLELSACVKKKSHDFV